MSSFLKSLAITGTATAATAVVGTIASADVRSRWYEKLRKPAFQPPPAAFPIAWTALYASIALASAAVLTSRDGSGRAASDHARAVPDDTGTAGGLPALTPTVPVTAGGTPVTAPGPAPAPRNVNGRRGRRGGRGRGFVPALFVNLILNAGWSWVFFRQHRLSDAVLVAGALTASSTDLARRAGRVRPVLGVTLAPYAAWCAFATALSIEIARLNPGHRP